MNSTATSCISSSLSTYQWPASILPFKTNLNLSFPPNPTRTFGTRISKRLGLGSTRYTRVAAMASDMKVDEGLLTKGIAEFYDESSGLWENLWGDHLHHGYYDPDSTASVSDHRAAQIRMIEEALRFAGISEDSSKWPKTIVDVGCGIGGSSTYLAKKYGAKGQGITLSPVQAERANALAAADGLADKVSFQVADALDQPFPDGQFDLVWSMESGEHMPDKTKFIAWYSTADYVKLLKCLQLQDIKEEDWSPFVAPFWPAAIHSVLSWKGLTSLLRSGLKTIKGALAMPLMIEGYKKDLIKYAIITCRKPE
ncbi:Gamma-tocopherol methyltransferase [Quillaja saponaria]|uniref:Gamma-tocopherol methyltransferase n=1 Tax=Quillaja saponaria TaxID=32244 RepID=A0AAD7QDH3_QUISA|nr:Gamma-tocopherol methyltransferase [Quillaja saponaria]